MSIQYAISRQEPSLSEEEESQLWAEQLARYLEPFRERLDAYLDRRVVGNLLAGVGAIVQSRSALTTSELGSGICGANHAEAGTQRLQYGLHHQGWTAEVIEEVLWEQAEERRQQIEQGGHTPLCIWDGSVIEKPESAKLEGLGAVRSSQARRLGRSRKTLYNQPSRIPVRVPGYEWESLLLVGGDGLPQVVSMRWWQREKGVAGQQRIQQEQLLSQVARRWGRGVRHIFDRGYGHGPWLWQLWRYQLRFAVRLSRKAISSSMSRDVSAKPGKSRAASVPGASLDCCGTRIVECIVPPGCWRGLCATLTIRENCGWWWCARDGDANRGICSPMNRWRPSSRPGRSCSRM